MKDIILASQSPRRRELLERMGVDFDVVPSGFDEKLDDSREPEEVAMELALGKAMAVAEQYPDKLIIGADTIVTIEGRQLEKPHDEAEAHEMLKLLSGKPHDLSTGLCLVRLSDGLKLVGADTVKVYFKPYDEDTVKQYIATGDPMDKAGGYGMQSGAAPLVERIEGRYDTIMGLPTKLLADFLTQAGVLAKQLDLKPPVPQILSDSCLVW